VKQGVLTLMLNSGQNCNAPSRMLVPESRLDEVEAIAAAAGKVVVGDPLDDTTTMGPLANGAQFEPGAAAHRQRHRRGREAGGRRAGAAGGHRPGFFVRPTIFSRVTPAMTIAREEIFGPVLSIMPYRDEDDAVRIANDTPYGLSGYVSSSDRPAPAAWPGACAPATCISTAPGGPRPSAATSSRASGGSGAPGASRNTSRPRRSSAMAPTEPRGAA
jgi:acyl-CoA reductase-like NAD-dependent aldehyde dehydrogenase